MLAITNNFQTNLAIKKPAISQQRTTFTAQPVIDTFTKSSPKQEISFNGKIWDAITSVITGERRNSNELKEYVANANNGCELHRIMVSSALCDNRALNDESLIAAIEMLKERGSKTDLRRIFDHVVCSKEKSEEVQVKAIMALPKMAERLDLNKNDLEQLHHDLEPIFYLPDDLEFAATTAQAQIQTLIDKKYP